MFLARPSKSRITLYKIWYSLEVSRPLRRCPSLLTLSTLGKRLTTRQRQRRLLWNKTILEIWNLIPTRTNLQSQTSTLEVFPPKTKCKLFPWQSIRMEELNLPRTWWAWSKMLLSLQLRCTDQTSRSARSCQSITSTSPQICKPIQPSLDLHSRDLTLGRQVLRLFQLQIASQFQPEIISIVDKETSRQLTKHLWTGFSPANHPPRGSEFSDKH